MAYIGILVALDPTPKQERALKRHAGASRFAYNACLAHVMEEYKAGRPVNTSFYSLRKWWNHEKATLAPWYTECSKESFAHGCESLAKAYSSFFAVLKGTRKGVSKYPRFKKRGRSRNSFAYTTGSFGPIKGDDYGLRLPRIGRIHTMENVTHRLMGMRRLLRMTISEDGGRWFASLDIEKSVHPLPPNEKKIGLDLGIHALGICSDGRQYKNPLPLFHAQKKVKKLQKKLNRQKRDSIRRSKTKNRLARLHYRIASQRRDAQHKMTTDLIRNYGMVGIEDLDISNMLQEHRLAAYVSDTGFFEIRQQLIYKALRYGRQIVIIDRFFPSSKRCSVCGTVKPKLSLKERVFHCEACGASLDRDLNAAKNILFAAESASEAENGHGETGRPARMAGMSPGSVNQARSLATSVRPGADSGNGVMEQPD